jgi:hypothetical protein
MLSFSKINEADFRKILGIRSNRDNFGQKMQQGDGDLVLPHETYAMGLSSLKRPVIPEPEHTGRRVIEVDNDGFHFLYELLDGSGVQMFRDKAFLSEYEQAFERIAADESQITYTVRILHIPALYIEALWLHDDADPHNDKFITVRSMSAFESNRLYTRSEFFSIVQDKARSAEPSDERSGA